MSGGAGGPIAVGRVLRPWGREGMVLVEPWTHDAGRFLRLGRVDVRGRTLEVVDARLDRRGRPQLRFAGIGSIEDAEKLRGAELLVAGERAERPAGPAYFLHELVGLEAIDAVNGSALGRVDEVLETPGTAVLVVRGDAGELLVPLAAPYIEAVEPEQATLRVHVPADLAALNREDERAV